jgi:hypothetical protein
MKRFAVMTGLVFLAACSGFVEDFPELPPDAQVVVVRADAGVLRPVTLADAGQTETPPDASTEPEPLPPCGRDPFRSDAPNTFELADWLVRGSPCARIDGLPDSGFVGDHMMYDGDRDGYLEYARVLPPGVYTLRLAPMDCRTHQFGDQVRYDDRTVSSIRSGDRDVFYCIPIPLINCLDWGNGNYTCWVEKIEFLCDLRIEVLDDGTIRGAGGMYGSYSIAQKCE